MQDKRHGVMELVEYKYSRNEHGLMKGIGVINALDCPQVTLTK